MRFFKSVFIFLGFVSAQDLCGESCEAIDKEFAEISDLIESLKAENAAIEAENAAIEAEINRLYVSFRLNRRLNSTARLPKDVPDIPVRGRPVPSFGSMSTAGY